MDAAAWPQVGKWKPAAPNAKYGASERPKTTLYEATRKLVVKQLKEDNGDIRADRFRLTSLGTTARLLYRAAFEPTGAAQLNGEGAAKPTDEEQKARLDRLKKGFSAFSVTVSEATLNPILSNDLVEGFKELRKQVSDPKLDDAAWKYLEIIFFDLAGVSDDDGFLLEWIQKTEIGRDFYTKESFAGVWMPFGFKAEVVTITERLPCTSSAATPKRDDVEMLEQESTLTAFLVARKFGRVRPERDGSLKREFPPAESADFLPWLSQIGREAGLQSVEVLTGRTPVLANHGVDFPLPNSNDTPETVLGRGDDLIVDEGNGKNAGREVFWPRVEDFEIVAGQPRRVLTVFKFPIRLTYLDGLSEIVQLPMFFAPTLTQGKMYYPMTLKSLRTADVSSQVAAVEPPPAATIGGADLVSGSALAELHDHLESFINDKDTEAILPNLDHPSSLNGPGATAAGLEVIASAVNVSLGNLPPELAKRLTVHRGKITEAFQGNDWDALAKTFTGAVNDLNRKGGIALNTVERAAAWGVEDIGPVDAATAAERLSSILMALKENGNSDVFEKAGTILKAALDKLTSADENLTKAKSQIMSLVSRLGAAKDAKFQEDVRKLGTQWGIRLAPYWQREAMDAPFRQLACMADPDLLADLFSAALHKEMHYAVLGGEVDVSPKFLKLTLNLSALANGSALRPEIRPGDLASQVQKVVDSLVAPAVENVAAAQKILQGVNDSLPEERLLRQRLHCLIDQHARLALAGTLEGELRPILNDIGAHLTFLAAHSDDGQARLSRFLAAAASGPEVMEMAKQEIGDHVNRLKDNVRQGVEKQLDKVGVETVSTALEKMLATANPDHIKQQLQQMLSLTGGRIAGEIKGRIDGVRSSANTLVAAIYAEADKADSDGRRAVNEAQMQLNQLQSAANGMLGSYRTLLESFFSGPEGGKLGASVGAEMEKLQKQMLGNAPKPVLAWLGQATALLEGKAISPRFLAMLDDLASALRETTSLSEGQIQLLVNYEEKIGRRFVDEVRGAASFTQAEFQALTAELQSITGAFALDLQARRDALTRLAQNAACQWIDRLDFLFVSLAATPKEFEAAGQAVLDSALGPLQLGGLESKLGQTWNDVQGVLNDLRGYVGDVQDFQAAVDRLSGKLKPTAQAKLKDLRGKLTPIASALRDDLKTRAAHVEGQALGFVKRALISLPSAALLNNFGDQSRNAVFKAQNLVFTAASAGEGLRGLMAASKLESLSVKLPGIDGFTSIKHADDYLKSGLRDYDAAIGQVYAAINPPIVAAGLAAGIGDPRTEIAALSRAAGALSSEAQTQLKVYGAQARDAAKEWVQQGYGALNLLKDQKAKLSAQVAGFLGNSPPKLFGQIDFATILKFIQNPGQIPKALSHEFPDRVENVLSMRNEAQPLDAGLLAFQPEDGTELRIESRTTAWLPLPGRPNGGVSNSTRGQLGPFKLVIGKAIGISFQSLTFVAENGDCKCHPKLGKVTPTGDQGGGNNPLDMLEFLGPLAFLQDVMKTFAAFLSGELPFVLRTDGESILAGIQIGLPTMGFGAFSMQNLSLGMSVGLPLSKDKPLYYRFNIADKVETFKVSVCGFTGGGFFALVLATDPDVGSIEAAIEFGGSLALNIGIAQGALSVMAGIYFRKGHGETLLSAYLRACGAIVVLGFIEVSIIFYLSMQYQRGALTGQASITIRVKIGFFSKSFRLSYTKTIAGSSQGSSDSTALLSPSAGVWYRLAGGEPPTVLLPVLRDAPGSRLAFPLIPVGANDSAPSATRHDAETPVATQFTQRVRLVDWSEHWRQFDYKALEPNLVAGCKRRRPSCLKTALK